jgi:putative ABC transport system permease protein
MNITNLKIIFRGIGKQKLSNALSIFVLTAGMASFMLIFFYISYEKGFDRSWQDADRIYRVRLNKTLPDGTVSKSAGNYRALGWVMNSEIPGVEHSTSLWEDNVMAYTHENFMTDVKFFWGDASFFNVFRLRFLEGDGHNPFPTVQSMVISESAARKLFGSEDPLGKSFKINEGWEFIVSGVFADIPEDSHLKVDILGTCNQLFYFFNHFDNATSTLRPETETNSWLPDASQSWLWSNPDAYTYVKLKKGVWLPDVESAFENIYKKYTSHILASGQKSEFVMQPVSDIHTGTALENEMSATINGSTIAALWTVAILALVMSWIIFINFQVTQSVERAKEIGLKKVVGARPSDLSFQIMAQSILINAVGLALALSVFFLLRKPLSDFLDLQHLIPVETTSLLIIVSIFMAGAVLSGLYPVYFLVSKSSRQLLSKHFAQKNDGFGLRRTLVVFQFAASIGLLIATSVIVMQVSYMKNKDIGLCINQTAYSNIPLSTLHKPGAAERMKTFMEEIDRLPGIISSTLSSSVPGQAINFHSNQIFPVNAPDKSGTNYGILTVENHLDEVYRPKLLAGKFFADDDQPGSKKLLINSEACRKLGFGPAHSAIGQFINVTVNDFLSIQNETFQICGVVEDFHQESARKVIEPLLIINSLRWKYEVGYISVAFDAHSGSNLMQGLSEKWTQFYPSDPFAFRFTNQTYQLQLKADKKLAGLFSVYTALSILLAAIGLLGLASNATRKRVKEIGIRKVNGAKVSEILTLLNKDFVKWIAIAFGIAVPVAWYAMDKWLENFAYKTELSWWIFALAGLLALGIALLTVSWQSWRAATRNPVEALRYE